MAGKKKINPDFENISSNNVQRDLYLFFEKFRELAGIEINAAGTPEEETIFYGHSGMLEVQPVTEQFTFSPLLSDEELKKELVKFSESIINHPKRSLLKPVWAKDTEGKKKDYRITMTILQKCYDIYYYKNVEKTKHDHIIASKTELLNNPDNPTDTDIKNAVREVRRYLEHADKLITAATESFEKFCAAAANPLPRNL